MEHYNKKDEIGNITYNGKTFDIKWYQGYLFATEELAAVIMDDDTGLAVSDEAEKLDEKIAYYFDEDDFYGKDGKELYELYENN